MNRRDAEALRKQPLFSPEDEHSRRVFVGCVASLIRFSLIGVIDCSSLRLYASAVKGVYGLAAGI